MYTIGEKMLIKTQPNRWSCVLAAFATAIEEEFSTLIEIIGHDGSDIIFPDLPEPFCRRAFQVQEMAIALWRLGYIVASYDVEPLAIVDEEHVYTLHYVNDKKLFSNIMVNSIGVGCARVMTTGKTHAFAWNGREAYDPTGFVYPISRYDIYSYHLIVPHVRVDLNGKFLF